MPLRLPAARTLPLLLLCAAGAHAASLTIPSTHPRLWFGSPGRL